MSNTDTSIATDQLGKLLKNFENNYHFRLHKMFNPMPVNMDWHIDDHRHITDLHLLYVIKGSGTYFLDEERIDMKKGQLFLVTNDFPHTAYSSQEDLIHMFSLRFGIYKTCNQTFLPNYFRQPFGSVFTPKDPEAYVGLLNRMYRHFLEQKPLSSYAINVLMSQLLLNLCEEPDQLDTTGQIQSITSSIIRRHGKDINLSTMAEQMNLSTKQFTRLFQKENHITPHQFIIKSRVNHAKYLLEESNLPISVIALELGYTDAFTFSKQFKKVTGLSPTNFRG